MTTTVFICLDPDRQLVGQGTTLKAAFEEYEANGGEEKANECEFYEATPVEIEVQLVIKEEVKSIARKL